MADNFDLEMEKLEKKIAAGVDILYTQPIYELRTLEALLNRTQSVGGGRIPVMLGLLPLRSYKHAEFLHNEIPGMTIPHDIREKLRAAGEKAGDVGVEMTVKFLEKAKSMIAGAYLMPPFKKYDIVPKILEGVGMLEEQKRFLV